VKPFRVIPIAGALVLAAGCSSSASQSRAGAPPRDGAYFANAELLLAALNAAGEPCIFPSVIANPTAPGAVSMTDCSSPQASGDQNGDTSVIVFDTHAHALSFAQGMVSGGLAPGAEEVIGVDWVVNTTPAYGVQVQLALGGSTLLAPSAAAG
jgi:hypothetical protein